MKKVGFVLPLWLTVALISIYPFAAAIRNSLTDVRLVALGRERFIGLANYHEAFNDKEFIRSILNTIIFVFCAVGIQFILGFALALLLHRHYVTKVRGIIRSLLLTPMFVTPVAVGLMFRYMMNAEYGIITYIARTLGLNIDFFSPSLALFSLVLIDVWQWTPFLFLLLSAGLESLPQDCYDAAKVDGAGPVATFWHITLPLLRPIIIVAILLRVLDAFRVFEYVYTITRGGPGGSTETIMYHIYQVGFRFFRMGEGSAKAVIFAGVILCIVLVMFYALKRVEKWSSV